MPRQRQRPTRLAVFDTEGTGVFDDPRGIFAVLYNWDYLELDDANTWHDMTRDNIADLTTRHEGRDCQSLYDFLNEQLADAEDGGYIRKVGVHNLSYDYAYLREWLRQLDAIGYSVECTAKGSTSILTITIREGKTPVMIWFDTLAIFAKSLRNLGDSLGFPKEHIDYSERIAPDTRYSSGNTNYNHRDTDVLMLAVCSSLLTRDAVDLDALGTRVLTKTSIVRKLDREHKRVGALRISARKSRGRGLRKRASKSRAKDSTIYDADRQIVQRYQYEDMEHFERWKSYGDSQTGTPGCFAGGVNLSNSHYLGVISENVMSYDLKSAYPAIMLSMQAPTHPRDIPAKDLALYDGYLIPLTISPVDLISGKVPYWRGTVRLENARFDPEWLDAVQDTSITESMILQHRHESEGIAWSDGHFQGARVLYLTLALPEWCELSLQFEWDSAHFTELTVYDQWAYPTHYTVLRTIMHYREKSTAKALGKAAKAGTITREACEEAEADGLITHDEALELQRSPDDLWIDSFVLGHKGNLNSLYGIMVTNPMKDGYSLDANDWLRADDKTPEELFDAYVGSSRDSKMWREFGVNVALFNRYKIVYMARLLVEAGATILYTDTDSIKFFGISKEQADAVFKPLHDAIEARTSFVVARCVRDVNERLQRYRAVTDAPVRLIEMPDDPDFHALGKLDYEGTYARFVSMGHKKYATWETDRADGKDKWFYRCSGYNLRVLREISAQLMEAGATDKAPLITLGYDVRLDSSTGIATAQLCIDNAWVETEFEAQDVTGDASRTHRWRGQTCPGFAIVDAGKVMNNTENSTLNAQRFARACLNNPLVRECSRVDIAWRDGAYQLGPRDSIRMDFKAWGLKESEERQLEYYA